MPFLFIDCFYYMYVNTSNIMNVNYLEQKKINSI